MSVVHLYMFPGKTKNRNRARSNVSPKDSAQRRQHQTRVVATFSSTTRQGAGGVRGRWPRSSEQLIDRPIAPVAAYASHVVEWSSHRSVRQTAFTKMVFRL